jgi:CxC2 like cysteine cluster associated with KDZ transposases
MKPSAHSVAVVLNLKNRSSVAETALEWRCAAGIVSLSVINAAHCILLRYVLPRYMVCSTNKQTQEWNGSFFQRTNLKLLGLRIQLGHAPSHRCYNPRPSSGNNFIVVDTNGIHEVALDFCGCDTAQLRYKQLLRARWYPATTTDPQTAATFNVLEHYHLLSYESKVSAYEFYHSLARRSDNTGLSTIRVSVKFILSGTSIMTLLEHAGSLFCFHEDSPPMAAPSTTPAWWSRS